MDVLTSSEFRKRYAKLTEATAVEVNGHYIGTWVPFRSEEHIPDLDEHLRAAAITDGFNTRPFTPVPKVRGK